MVEKSRNLAHRDRLDLHPEKCGIELLKGLNMEKIGEGKYIFKENKFFNFPDGKRETSFFAKINAINQIVWKATKLVTGSEISYIIDCIKKDDSNWFDCPGKNKKFHQCGNTSCYRDETHEYNKAKHFQQNMSPFMLIQELMAMKMEKPFMM